MALELADKIIFDKESDTIKAIQNGADVNEWDKYGFRPLIEAIICDKPEVFSKLLEYGADVDQVDILGRSPLQWAAERSNFDYCRQLLDLGANPNHYSADGQPLLVYPILREEYELVKMLVDGGAEYSFAQDFISAKLIGHRFELSGEIDIAGPKNNFVPLSFEGFYLEFTCDLIKRSLNNFINSIKGQKFNKFHAKLNKIINSLKYAGQLMIYSKHQDKTPFLPIIDTILDNDLLILPVGHAGHAITFIKYGNIWAKCDRGVNKFADTVMLYEINNPYSLNNELLHKLLYGAKDKDFINKDLKNILSLKYIQKLPTSMQIAGNCSWANVEASVTASLFALCYVEEYQDRNSTAQLKRSITSFYNAWVEWDKDSALEELIADFESLSGTRKISKAVILSSILVQRCHHTIHPELARAKKIVPHLAQPEFKFILERIRETYNRRATDKVGNNIMQLLDLSGLDLDTLTLNSNNKIKTTITNNNIDNEIRMTTALHIACLNNQFESVKYLLEKIGIDVNYQDRTGSTPLMYAAWKGNLKIVKYLVNKHNADISITNLKGGNAKRYAMYAGHIDIVDFLSKKLS